MDVFSAGRLLSGKKIWIHTMKVIPPLFIGMEMKRSGLVGSPVKKRH
jgi:hypothetical protein